MDPETRKHVQVMSKWSGVLCMSNFKETPGQDQDTLGSQLAREHLSDPLEEQEEVERNPEPDGVRKWMTRMSLI